jgi:Cys-tRNA(Pro)/Cys-tRNA(Cys) deacylase
VTKKKAGAAAATPAIRVLREAGVEFEILEFELDDRPVAPGTTPASTTGAARRHGQGFGTEAATKLGLDATVVFKTLMVQLPDESLAAGVVPVSGSLDLRAMAAALGVKRVSMADPGRAQKRTGYVVGGISPLGQRHQAPVVVDASVMHLESVLVSGGQRGLDLKLAPRDLVAVAQATVAEIAAP